MKMNLVVPCLFGLESLIAEELRNFGAENVMAENGRVLFCGDENILARANINSRYAERILILVGSFDAHTFDELFEGTRALEWGNWFEKTDAFPVKGYSVNSTLFSVSDCQAIIKKAVVEKLKQKYKIEWFEETGPIHQIQFSILKNKVSVLLDTSGPGLHKRGYRLDSNTAPIKETLAAALCGISKLRPYHTLYDPMCGSGTILIEGAMMAKNIAPGVSRNFSAERWSLFPETVWSMERERAKSLVKEVDSFIAFGSDIDKVSLEYAQANAERAGVAELINYSLADFADFSPDTQRGTLICNPPYGERMLDVDLSEQLYKQMGEIFVQKQGWSYTIISPSETFESSFGRKADKRRKLYNGMIKCQAFMYYK
ncbi:MAG: class I SAM-dependent RNA methyltransferase [Clostridiales bacterium]|nr:class I SAM-dependent RNA methyltransferase [Clostridiales bacterium]